MTKLNYFSLSIENDDVTSNKDNSIENNDVTSNKDNSHITKFYNGSVDQLQ